MGRREKRAIVLRKIKYGILIVFLILICAGIVKDKIFDTPEKDKQKIASFLEASAKKNLKTNIFETNKTFVYKMYFWSLIPMGELRFKTQVDDLGNIFSLEATSQGSCVDKFIRAKADINSYYSKNIHLPYKYTEITQVEGKTKTKTIILDQANLIMATRNLKFKIPLNTYDFISAFVSMLTKPLKKGSEGKIRFVTGKNIYILKSTVLDEANGMVEILVDIRRENLTSNHGARFRVWITQDNARVPLVFKSWNAVGYASAILDRVE